MESISLQKVNRFALRKQHLTGDNKADNVIQVAEDISGLHATGIKEPYLAAFTRMSEFSKRQLDDELNVRKALVKFRCMRGTLYILTREMLPVACSATRAMVEKLSRRYAEFRGISPDEYDNVSKLILRLLKGKVMTAPEIKSELGKSLYLSAVLNLMCDQGLLARINPGSGRANHYLYALFHEYYNGIDLNKYSEAEALPLLVLRYLCSFGPANEDDITWWIGATKTKVKAALDKIKSRITEIKVENLEGDLIILRSELESAKSIDLNIQPEVSLLPTLDPYLMGYRHRERYLDRERYDKVFDRSGNATSTVIVNGRIAGVWDASYSIQPQIKLYLFEKVGKEALPQVMMKAKEMGRFLTGKEVEIRTVAGMVPLKQRPAGAFMSPLKNSEEK